MIKNEGDLILINRLIKDLKARSSPIIDMIGMCHKCGVSTPTITYYYCDSCLEEMVSKKHNSI